jgi:septum site-determining protein MinC
MPVHPTGSHSGSPTTSFDIKSAQLSLVALVVKTPLFSKLANDLIHQFGPLSESPDFFDLDPLVLDFSQVDVADQDAHWLELLSALKNCRLFAVAVRGLPPSGLEQAKKRGLTEAPPESKKPQAIAKKPVETPGSLTKEGAIEKASVKTEVVPALVIDKPLRSGQKVYARGGDLVVMAMVNRGAEVIADGNIHVYAPLRGKAMAGARGNTQARIFSLCMEPELVSIAGVYRTTEKELGSDVLGKPAQVRLSNDGQEKLIIEALSS